MAESKQAELEAAFEDAAKKDNRCTLGTLIDEHPEGQTIADKVADERFSAPVIVAVLDRVLGVRVGRETVTKHRKGTCRCKA